MSTPPKKKSSQSKLGALGALVASMSPTSGPTSSPLTSPASAAAASTPQGGHCDTCGAACVVCNPDEAAQSGVSPVGGPLAPPATGLGA